MAKARLLLTIMFSGVVVLSAAAQSQLPRSVFFEVGIGPARIEYPSETAFLLDAIEQLPGVDRIRLYLHLSGGSAIGANLYAVASIHGFADRFDYLDSYVQLNSYLFSGGLRWYPLVTGLTLGADVGLSRMVVMASELDAETSDWGNGWSAMIGYDFARRPRGVSPTIGVRMTSLNIEGDIVVGTTAFVSLTVK